MSELRPLRQALGRLIRATRQRERASQAWLAASTGLSRQMVSVVERGVGNPSLAVIERLLSALDLDVDVVVRDALIVLRPRLDDAAHALCSAYVQRRLEAAGWLVAREVRIETGRYLGWMDLLAFDPGTGTLIVIEIKTRLDDLGGLERTLDRYATAARAAARRLGWAPSRIHAWTIALASDEVDHAIRDHREAVDVALPVRARAMLAGVRAPELIPVGRGLALVDPSSRRRDWLIRTGVDGRRSPAPYRGYADFLDRRRQRQ